MIAIINTYNKYHNYYIIKYKIIKSTLSFSERFSKKIEYNHYTDLAVSIDTYLSESANIIWEFIKSTTSTSPNFIPLNKNEIIKHINKLSIDLIENNQTLPLNPLNSLKEAQKIIDNLKPDFYYKQNFEYKNINKWISPFTKSINKYLQYTIIKEPKLP